MSLHWKFGGNNKCEVIYIRNFKEEAVIRQQIALNKRIYDLGKISKTLHDKAQRILIDRLTRLDSCDIVLSDEDIYHSKIM